MTAVTTRDGDWDAAHPQVARPGGGHGGCQVSKGEVIRICQELDGELALFRWSRVTASGRRFPADAAVGRRQRPGPVSREFAIATAALRWPPRTATGVRAASVGSAL